MSPLEVITRGTRFSYTETMCIWRLPPAAIMWDGDGTQGPGVSQGGLDDDLFTTNKQYYYHKKRTRMDWPPRGVDDILLDRTPVPNIHPAAVGLVDRRYCGSYFT
jgi:hypothetical protein